MLGVALEVQGPGDWIGPLCHAWTSWTPAEGIPCWSVTITPDAALGAPAGPLFAVRPQCEGEMCLLSASGFQGVVDALEGSARLSAHPQATPADVGYFLRVALAVQAFRRGGALFHAAGVVRHGTGFALFGLSGSGKTTAARFSAPHPVLNDDLLLLWPAHEGAGWELGATPFGKRRGDVRRAPLRALLRLVKAPEVRLVPLRRSRALAELIANTPVVSGNAAWLPDVMSFWETVMDAVPVQALHFRRDGTFWEVIDAQWG